jgi:hypothetical protein
MKTEVIAFRGNFPFPLKITVDNKSITEHVSDFNYLDCNVTYNYDGDLYKKT